MSWWDSIEIMESNAEEPMDDEAGVQLDAKIVEESKRVGEQMLDSKKTLVVVNDDEVGTDAEVKPTNSSNSRAYELLDISKTLYFRITAPLSALVPRY